MDTTIQFLGAADTVTGSKFLLDINGFKLMVDCGLFQGVKNIRSLNREPLPVDVSTIDCVLLTHGHMDHTGYLPKMYKDGFRGKIMGTSATLDIAAIILKDSAKIQEEDAKRANEEKFTRHSPATPLYNSEDAEHTIKLFHPINTESTVEIAEEISAVWKLNGHILGSCFIELNIQNKKWVFSGDVGRKNDLLLEDPQQPEYADYLVMESTYGDQLHPKADVKEKLREMVHHTYQKGGTLIIPAFAVERIQMMMLYLSQLKQEKDFPPMKMIMDSPMASAVLNVFEKHYDDHKLSPSEISLMRKQFDIIEDFADTWKAIEDKSPKIVVAGSGMITGGRVLSYLKIYLDQPSTTLLITGYQAEGTRGRDLLEGATQLKFYGKYYDVKAEVFDLEVLSAHADQKELMDWMSKLRQAPEKNFLVHGEPHAADALRRKIEEELHWQVVVPHLFETHKIK